MEIASESVTDLLLIFTIGRRACQVPHVDETISIPSAEGAEAPLPSQADVDDERQTLTVRRSFIPINTYLLHLRRVRFAPSTCIQGSVP